VSLYFRLNDDDVNDGEIEDKWERETNTVVVAEMLYFVIWMNANATKITNDELDIKSGKKINKEVNVCVCVCDKRWWNVGEQKLLLLLSDFLSLMWVLKIINEDVSH